MKKYLIILLTTFVLMQNFSVFGADYDASRADTKNVICAIGNMTNDKLDIMCVDTNGCDYIVLILNIDGATNSKFSRLNEYGYAIATFDNMVKGKAYSCYVITYKNGIATYSNENVFKYGED